VFIRTSVEIQERRKYQEEKQILINKEIRRDI